MSSKLSLLLTSAAVIAALAAILVKSRNRIGGGDADRMESVLQSLSRQETERDFVSSLNPPRIALGYGACQDLFIDAKDFLAGRPEPPPDKPEHYNEIATRDQLSQMFAYFFEHGAAAE